MQNNLDSVKILYNFTLEKYNITRASILYERMYNYLKIK